MVQAAYSQGVRLTPRPKSAFRWASENAPSRAVDRSVRDGVRHTKDADARVPLASFSGYQKELLTALATLLGP